MGDLVQVTFHFGGSTEIRYIDAPKVGDPVHAVDGDTWRITDVLEDEGRFVVDCEPLENRSRTYEHAGWAAERRRRIMVRRPGAATPGG